MPLNRTPPPTGDVPTFSRGLSEQNLPKDMEFEYENTPNIPFHIRRKRSGDTISVEIKSFMSEMRNLFTEFKTEQDVKFNKMYNKMEEVLKQNSEMRTSIDFLSNTCDSLNTRIDDLQSERKNYLHQLQLMEEKLETLERKSKSTCIEIRNIPQSNTETKDSLINTAINISKKINVSLQPHDINDIFRINSREQTRKTIIVDLASVILKEKIVKMYRIYNKKQRLDTEFLKIENTPTPIFISENLTFKVKKVFFLAREFAKTKDYRYCWVSNGKVFLRRREGEKYLRIRDETELLKLKEMPA
ncbi:jg3102 [Pararge aegeria aegeria]|uniref:Jg3102 protein n=1 Tax=Pararge aegeria aegeria TaxID=348720 RepID=A0A8S4QQH0_9NEOP|nr:jg3102 [Pararge aegeria aegeria]